MGQNNVFWEKMSSEEELDDFDVNDYDLAAAMGQEKSLIFYDSLDGKIINFVNF